MDHTVRENSVIIDANFIFLYIKPYKSLKF